METLETLSKRNDDETILLLWDGDSLLRDADLECFSGMLLWDGDFASLNSWFDTRPVLDFSGDFTYSTSTIQVLYLMMCTSHLTQIDDRRMSLSWRLQVREISCRCENRKSETTERARNNCWATTVLPLLSWAHDYSHSCPPRAPQGFTELRGIQLWSPFSAIGERPIRGDYWSEKRAERGARALEEQENCWEAGWEI